MNLNFMKALTLITLLIGLSSAFTSCDKCMRCTYSYTTTTTEFTPNGEVTFTDTITGQSLPNNEGTLQSEQCGSDEDLVEFETRYAEGNSNGQFENYSYNCVEQ